MKICTFAAATALVFVSGAFADSLHLRERQTPDRGNGRGKHRGLCVTGAGSPAAVDSGWGASPVRSRPSRAGRQRLVNAPQDVPVGIETTARERREEGAPVRLHSGGRGEATTSGPVTRPLRTGGCARCRTRRSDPAAGEDLVVDDATRVAMITADPVACPAVGRSGFPARPCSAECSR
jgi:hypothetical protein